MGEKKGFFGRLAEGLAKTRNSIVSGIEAIFSGSGSIDEDFYEELEEILIMADIGVNATSSIIENLRAKVKENKIKEPAQCRELLITSIKEQMNPPEGAYDFEEKKTVLLVIGVNGVGKTTSVGKLAGQYKETKEERYCRGGGYLPRGGDRAADGMGAPRTGRYYRTEGGLGSGRGYF